MEKISTTETSECGNEAHKDLLKKISTLEFQNEARAIRTSLLNAKLQETLDTLDALTTTHAQELSLEERTNERLQFKLRTARNYAKGLEKERDELRDVVQQLVDKVEKCDDFGLWPHNQMHISEHLEPLPPCQGDMPKDSKDDLKYATMVISSLKADLQNERQHVKVAEREIADLQAKLARREAELEICVVHTGHFVPFDEREVSASEKEEKHGQTRSHSRTTKRRKIPASSLSKEDIEKLFGFAIARNQSLELEVKAAKDRLEGMNAEKTPYRPDRNREVESPRRPLKPNLSAYATPSARPTPKSPNLAPLISEQSPSPYVLSPPRRTSPTPPTMTTSQAEIRIMSVQRQMEEQLQRLAAAIDDLATERRHFRELFDKRAREEAEDTDEPTAVEHTNLARIHGSARAVPQNASTGQSAVPVVFKSNPPLEASCYIIAGTKVEQGRTEQATVPSIIDLLDGDVPPRVPPPLEPTSKKSMELATPLQPTLILGDASWHSRQGETVGDQVDPAMVPLPMSPPEVEVNLLAVDVDARPPEDNIVIADPADEEGAERSTSEHLEQRIEQLEDELRLAREELSETNEALQQLRHLVDMLQLEMEGGDLLSADVASG
ncbi:unnamed protein product [Somion occarium]|uniref:Uncharacterized protein n=1 Tax=Somion occarium TaxID=3059160 RepID=A0ABP1E6U1_9APHY